MKNIFLVKLLFSAIVYCSGDTNARQEQPDAVRILK